MSPSKCSSRQSHSDYCSVDSYSSDEESTSSSPLPTHQKTAFPAGVCPHCHRIFEQPVSLQCGHSLCLICCNTLLHSDHHSTNSFRRRPRMGVRSLVCTTSHHSADQKIYRTPKCLVCGAPPNEAMPIPNIELDNFLRNIKSVRWVDCDQTEKSNKRKWEDEGVSINECKIAVVGSSRVGKTCFTRVQYGNEIMFPDMLNENDDGDTYIIDIVDDMEVHRTFSSAHGIIVMYSIADRHSFYEAANILKRIEQEREHNQPMILVGSKKDKERRREITSFEGQQLARSFEIPFLEVSAKNNDCVQETFSELVAMIQRQQSEFKNVVERTIIQNEVL